MTIHRRQHPISVLEPPVHGQLAQPPFIRKRFPRWGLSEAFLLIPHGSLVHDSLVQPFGRAFSTFLVHYCTPPIFSWWWAHSPLPAACDALRVHFLMEHRTPSNRFLRYSLTYCANAALHLSHRHLRLV